jgi:hypothetical protein
MKDEVSYVMGLTEEGLKERIEHYQSKLRAQMTFKTFWDYVLFFIPREALFTYEHQSIRNLDKIKNSPTEDEIRVKLVRFLEFNSFFHVTGFYKK